MVKTYSRRIFGGKDASWIGIDQGKHPLYPSALGMSLNAIYDDNVFKSRIGQEKDSTVLSFGVLTGCSTINYVLVGSGFEIFVEELYG